MPARFRTDGDETLGIPGVSQMHYSGAGCGHGVFILSGDVGQQHHLGSLSPRSPSGVFHRLDVAFVHVFEAGQQHAFFRLQVVFGLNDGCYCLSDVGTVEFQTNGADVLRHTVQDESCRGDKAVAALLLHAWQAA